MVIPDPAKELTPHPRRDSMGSTTEPASNETLDKPAQSLRLARTRQALLARLTTSPNMPQSLGQGLLDNRDWEDVTPGATPYLSATEWAANKWHPGRLRWPAQLKSLFSMKAASSPEKERSTAWLDGLRGFAALIVYWHHHQLWVHSQEHFENSFGYRGKYSFATLPAVRLFFAGGNFAVTIFFVISGYVLSHRPLQLLHAGDHLQLGDHIASALFRRWFRLYIPLFGTLFLIMTLSRMTGVWVHSFPALNTWREHVWHFYADFKNFSWVFNTGGSPYFAYSDHVWSIPVEFKGSMAVYASLFALSRSSLNARLLCEAALIFYTIYIADGAHCAMFLTGMLLCDLDLLAKNGQLPQFLARLEPAKGFIYCHLFLFSLYLGGVPSENDDVNQLAKNRGWYYLSFLKPQAVFNYKWFFLWCASTFMVSSVPRITWLRRFFETRFCQYLGRISFSLYLIHGPVLWSIGARLYLAVGWPRPDIQEHVPEWFNVLPLPKTGPDGLEVAFLLPHLLLLPLTLLLAEMGTRAFDKPSVKIASWLYKTTLGPSEPILKQAKA
ncbi:O-acetyltransferase PaAT-1 [Paramyrothecium foliicola]|nr:O-acetyltransferase PaAT-1 [Paramyrothecium foliicola]